jgi:SAM-dependent methyltransferase
MTDNSDQIAEWNGALGQRWAEMQAYLDVLTGPFGAAALSAATIKPGERVIDVGCGCGDTSFAIARTVGAHGSVLGVDVSQPMLEVARDRLADESLSQLRFRQADAASADLPSEQDLVFSRFGVMFFDAPITAFSQLRRTLRRGGRIAFCCWRQPRENPWAMAPLVAAREALMIETPKADPFAPGPFAFADAARLDDILATAGFSEVSIDPFDAPVRLGSNPRAAAENSARFGPASRLIRDVGEEALPTALAAIETALGRYAASDGSVAPPGAVWIVTAMAG